jgi:hypothetical protein
MISFNILFNLVKATPAAQRYVIVVNEKDYAAYTRLTKLAGNTVIDSKLSFLLIPILMLPEADQPELLSKEQLRQKYKGAMVRTIPEMDELTKQRKMQEIQSLHL